MTLAWYGHLRLQQTGISRDWPLIGVIVFSWAIAFLEYCCQVPANRIGFDANGGPFSLVQLKVIQECISLVVFAIIANLMFQGQSLHWNHVLAFVLIICAVYLVFMKYVAGAVALPLPYLYNNVSTTLLYKLHEPVAHIDTPLSYLRYYIIAKQRYLKRIDTIFYQLDTCEDYADSELRLRPTYDFYLKLMSSGKSMDLLR